MGRNTLLSAPGRTHLSPMHFDSGESGKTEVPVINWVLRSILNDVW